MDSALEPFQLELDTHLQPFYESLLQALTGDSGSGCNTVTTSLKESDLWECRQLGVDSPIVLVFTMLYFNTKFFRLYTAEQHEQLSFSNVQKVVQKRTSSGSNVSLNGSPSISSKPPAKVYSLQYVEALKTSKTKIPLFIMKKNNWKCFYPSVGLTNGQRLNTKKPMEQPQNVDRPGICPVKHYNFYVMKW